MGLFLLRIQLVSSMTIILLSTWTWMDMDVDGTDNSFVQVKMAKQTVKNGQTPRKSFWKAERHIAKTEKDAQIKLSLYQPSEFHVINPSKKTKIGNPVGYKVVPGVTAASLLDHNILLSTEGPSPTIRFGFGCPQSSTSFCC